MRDNISNHQVLRIHLPLRGAWHRSLLLFMVIASWGFGPSEAFSEDPSGKTIGSISIEVRDIFENPANVIYRGANQLKISTQESVIRRELLFREGDTYNAFAVEESERVLRQLGYLRDVHIVENHRPDGIVDITVSVQDTWTIIPQLSYSSGDGRTKTSIGLAESDLLGYGKRVEFGYAKDEGTDTLQLVYDDRNLLGTTKQLQAAAFTGNSGDQYLLDLGDPYRSLVQKRAWSTSVNYFDGMNRLYENGNERYLYQAKRQNYTLGYSFADGDPETTLQRYTLGYSYRADEFNQATLQDYDDLDLDPEIVSNDPGQLADNRRFSGLYLGIEQIRQDFISLPYIDRFQRIEDFNIGRVLATSALFAPDFLGSTGDWLLWQGEASRGLRLGSQSFLRGEVSAETRFDGHRTENSLLHTEGRYYDVLGDLFVHDLFLGQHTLASAIALDYADDLDRDKEFLLGADTGLRGYQSRTFTGDKRFVLNVEERAHLAENILDIFSLGTAAFAEIGGSTDRSLGRLFADELYSDIGVGLRIGFPRSSGERVIRVDLAFPMRDGPDGSGRFELRIIFAGGQLFPARLSTERAAQRRASVDF